jgi:hypothetical protein
MPYAAAITHPDNTPFIPSQTPLYENTFQRCSTLPQTLKEIVYTLENSAGNIDTPQKEIGYWSKKPSTDPENKYVSTPTTVQDFVSQYVIRDLPGDYHPVSQQYDLRDSGLDIDTAFETPAIRNEGVGNPSSKSEDTNVLSSQASSHRILPPETDFRYLNSKYKSYVIGTHLPLYRFNYHSMQDETLPVSSGGNGIFHSKSSNVQEEKTTDPSQVDTPLTRREDDTVQPQVQSRIRKYNTDPSPISKKRESNDKSYYKYPSIEAVSLD